MRNIRIQAILLLAIFSCMQLSAQTKKTDTAKAKSNYKFSRGLTMHKDYIDKILNKKVKLLEHYLTVLVEKKEPNYTKAIDKAMLLFNNDDSKLISVTSKVTGQVTIKPVREYLTAVSKLPYKHVDITYRNYTAIENIRKQPDGTYKGVAVLQQEFTGYDKEGKAMYNDIVKKNVEVIVRVAEHRKDDKLIAAVDIFFGNIGVSEL